MMMVQKTRSDEWVSSLPRRRLAVKLISVSRVSSEGWKVRKKIYSHRFPPLISMPMKGTSISKMRENTKAIVDDRR